MYDNIGAKIKILAIVIAVLGAISSLIGGIILFINDMVERGFIAIIGGVVLSWISTWVLYGFGELIIKTTEIADNTAKPVVIKTTNTNIPIYAQPQTCKPKKIADLEALVEIGMITQEEFEQQKKQFLDER